MKTIQVKEFRIKQSKSPSPTKSTPKIENAINTKTLTTLRKVKERKKTINQENQTSNDEPNDNMINLIEIYEKTLFKGSNFKNNEYENCEDNTANDNYLKDFYTKYEEKEINFSIFKNKINKNQKENELFLIKKLLNKYTDKITNYSNINGDQFLNANKLKKICRETYILKIKLIFLDNNLNNSKGASKNKDLERIKLNWKLQKQFLMTKKDVLKFSNPNNKIGIYDKNKTIELELNTDFIEENIREEKDIDKKIEKLANMTFLKIKSEKSYFL